MATRRIEFDGDSLLRLLTHYSDGAAVPLDAELRNLLVNKFLQRCLALDFATHEPGPQLAQVRYEGRKVMVWSEKGTPVEWREGNEAPKER